MKGLFKQKPRSPVELVRYAHELLLFIDRNDEVREQKREEKISELNKTLSQMRTVLYGNAGAEPSPDACAQLTQEFFNENTFRLLIACIPRLNLGLRQCATHVLTNLQRQLVKSRIIASEYLEKNMDVMDILILGYEDSDIAITYGTIARECIRHQCVARYILESEHMRKLFDYIQSPIFYVASEASETFRILLTRHKSTVAGFLTKNYDWFFEDYNMKLLESTNYIAKRHAVKLLGDILLDNSNAAVMVRYVSSLDNMRILMNLLRDPNKTIQRDGFDVFKLFVANRNKPPEITGVLVANRTKLLRFLDDLKLEKADEGFEEDKTQVIREISILESNDPSSLEMENCEIEAEEGFEEDKTQVIREISILESSDPSSLEMENCEIKANEGFKEDKTQVIREISIRESSNPSSSKMENCEIKADEGFEEDKTKVIREISILESSKPSSSEMENCEINC